MKARHDVDSLGRDLTTQLFTTEKTLNGALSCSVVRKLGNAEAALRMFFSTIYENVSHILDHPEG